jgi:NAD(P)H dehydrogenase (quinone)
MIGLTGATGQYGRLVLQHLLTRVPAEQIVAITRKPADLADLTERGVHVRQADYDQPDTLPAAFIGVDKLLLVPGAVYGRRFPQIRDAVQAAVQAGVSEIVYPSFVNTGSTRMNLGQEHAQAEDLLRSSDIAATFLRNGPYIEMYTNTVGMALQYGAILGSSGQGRYSGATRADLAEAAAIVLAEAGHTGKTYELGGSAFTQADLAAEVTRQTGTSVVYRDLPEADYAQALAGNGLPQDFAGLLADTSTAASRGDWYTDSDDLARLLQRPPTSLSEAVADALRAGTDATLDPRG